MTVSGRILFERVPFLPLPQDGLNYPGTFTAPAREIEVELLQAATGAVLATAMTDANGNYALYGAPQHRRPCASQSPLPRVGNHGASGCVGPAGAQ